MRNLLCYSLLMLTVSMLVDGCANVQRMTPMAPGRVNIKLADNDYTLLASVKGASTLKSYPLGIVQVIDDSKIRVLGIKFFEDKYSLMKPSKKLDGIDVVVMVYFWPYVIYKAYTYSSASVSAEDRAYYKILAATPDADGVIENAFVRQKSGIPFIYTEEEITLTGKAIKYKP